MHGWRRIAIPALMAATGLYGVSLLPPGTPAAPGASPEPVASYGSVPLGFERNAGQTHSSIRYLSRGSGFGLYLRRRDAVVAFGKPSRPAVLRIVPVGGSSHPSIVASGRLPRTVNYLTGHEGTRLRRGVPVHRRVTYAGVYPGIDMVFRGSHGALEYDFVVAPGASPDVIRVAIEGGRSLSLSPRGDLLIETSAGQIRQRRPVLYQVVDGRRRRVAGRFVLRGDRIGFHVGSYDRARELVIDPVIEYSGFLGGATGYDQAQALAVDGQGAAYVAGMTFAADFPVSGAASDATANDRSVCAPAQNPWFQPEPVAACRSDAFVTKLNREGTDIVYSTFLGGSDSDRVQDIDVDGEGFAYVAGGTASSDFPTTPNAVDRRPAGPRRIMGAGLEVFPESFVAKLAPDGSRLVYSTLLGGGDSDEAMGVRAGADGATYVTGHSFSADYPTTAGAFDRELNSPGAAPNQCADIFVTKLAAEGTSLSYSTLVGGSRLDFGWKLDIDAEGAAYVLGESTANDAPTTPGALQETGHAHEGAEHADCAEPLAQFDDADPLVMKVAPDGSALSYSTYLGGSRHEHGIDIAVHDGSAFVVGHTNSPDFPTTPGAYDRAPKATGELFDGFAAKLAPDGRRLEYSTLLAGARDDWVFGVAVDAGGSAYLTGMTTSPDFPTTDDALDSSHVGPGAPFYDAFLTRLSPDASRLSYSSYFGGVGPDIGLGVAEDGAGGAYIAGVTYSPDLPASRGALSPVFKGPVGYSDAFVAKFAGFPPTAAEARLEDRPSQRRAQARSAAASEAGR